MDRRALLLPHRELRWRRWEWRRRIECRHPAGTRRGAASDRERTRPRRGRGGAHLHPGRAGDRAGLGAGGGRRRYARGVRRRARGRAGRRHRRHAGNGERVGRVGRPARPRLDRQGRVDGGRRLGGPHAAVDRHRAPDRGRPRAARRHPPVPLDPPAGRSERSEADRGRTRGRTSPGSGERRATRPGFAGLRPSARPAIRPAADRRRPPRGPRRRGDRHRCTGGDRAGVPGVRRRGGGRPAAGAPPHGRVDVVDGAGRRRRGLAWRWR